MDRYEQGTFVQKEQKMIGYFVDFSLMKGVNLKSFRGNKLDEFHEIFMTIEVRSSTFYYLFQVTMKN